MVSAFRFGFLGVSDVDVTLSFAIMIAAAVTLFSTCTWLLYKDVGLRESIPHGVTGIVTRELDIHAA